jgi:hypothetical protein
MITLKNETSNIRIRFEYLFYLIKLLILAGPKFQKKTKKTKKKSKLGRNNRISELGLICTQKGQQINKFDFSMFLVFFLEKLFESLHFLCFYVLLLAKVVGF